MVARRVTQHPASRWRDVFPWLLAGGLCLAALLITARVATVVFDRLPHVEDEVTFLFQAESIASGQLVVTAPRDPDFFSIPFIIVKDGRWFGKYQPGYPAVLALGVRVGQPWLTNPVLGALCVGLVYLIGKHLYGAATGLLAGALLVASPFFQLQAGSFMSHTAALFWGLVALLLYEVALRTGRWPAFTLAGAALGILFLTRPLTAVGAALPLALWAAVDALRAPRRVVLHLALLLGFLPAVGALLAYNRLTTGDPLKSAYELWWAFDKVGFGPDVGPEGHDLARGIVNMRFELDQLATYLFGWPRRLSALPPLLAVALALLGLLWQGGCRVARALGARRGRVLAGRAPGGALAHGWDLLLAGVFLGIVLVQVAYWHGGPTAVQVYGPRYYFEGLGALVLLSARAVLQLGHLAARPLGRVLPRAWRPRLWPTVALLLVVAGLSAHSFRHFAPQEFRRFTGFYRIDGAGLRTVQAEQPHQALVFVSSPPGHIYTWQDYAPFFLQNAIALDGEVVYAADLGDARDRDLMAQYPGRAYYRYARHAENRLVPLTP